MDETCPACGRLVNAMPPMRNRADIERRIEELRRKIDHLENGEGGVIATQSAAPSCTICEQAPPGKKANPSGVEDQVRFLQRQVAELESRV